ncbi:MAG: hypothetical protein FK730_14170 [Asgard group archaeon]|nr:hypothetical protein [Asgard group archaeon]
MNRKLKILLLIKIVVLLFLVGNVTKVYAYNRSWNPGDVFTFTYSDLTIITDTDLEYNVQNKLELLDQETGTLNVTELNLLSERYWAIWTGKFGEGPIIGYDFAVADYISTYLDLSSFLIVDYEWDYGTNSTIFVDFDINIDAWLLIEPNWADLNTAFVDMFNESEVIETVADPYQPIIYNITLGDFLNDTSYTFMGKSTLADAKAQMESSTTAWSFTFDLSNVIYSGVFNGTLGYDEYYPYQTAVITYEMSYSKGGVLEKALEKGSISITMDNYKSDLCTEIIITQGDFRALTGNFAYWMILPGFLLILTVMRIAKRKSNRRKR